MTVTEVYNLATGKTAAYSQPAEQAVKLAHIQLTLHDGNWWDYDRYANLPVERTKHGFAVCGDWCARIEQKEVSAR